MSWLNESFQYGFIIGMLIMGAWCLFLNWFFYKRSRKSSH